MEMLIPAALGFGASALMGGGGGRTTGQSMQQADIKSPEQMGILNRLISMAQPQIGQPGRVPPSGLGPLGPSGLQQQAFGMAGQLPGQMAFDPSQITGAMAPVGQFAQNMFQQETIPSIMGALGAQGMARSSGAADILGRQGRNLGMGLGAQFGPMQFAGLQQSLGRQMQLPGQMANIGAVQRGIPGEQQAFELSRFMQQDPFRNPAINLALQSIGIPTTENIAFQGYRQPSLMESFLPAAGTMMGGWAQGGFQGLS